MRFVLKIIVILLNLIFAPMKLLPVQDKVTFISRQSDDKSEDMELLKAELIRPVSSDKADFPVQKIGGKLSL